MGYICSMHLNQPANLIAICLGVLWLKPVQIVVEKLFIINTKTIKIGHKRTTGQIVVVKIVVLCFILDRENNGNCSLISMSLQLSKSQSQFLWVAISIGCLLT